jgi:O-antigen/teichoic acid export membrane protein
MIGFLKDSHAVGLYSTAAKTSMLFIFILQSFNTLFSPQISDLYNKNDICQLEKMFKTVTRWAITLTFPVVIFMVFWAKDILNIFGKIFIDAYLPLIILAIGQFFNISMGSVGSMLVMTGRNWIVLLYSFLIFGLNLFLNYILIPKYGISGAAIATASSITILNLLYLMTVYYILKIHPYEMAVIKPVIGGAIAIGISLTLFHFMAVEWKWELMISLITIMTSYILILVLLRFDENDKIILKDLKERVVNKVIITANNKH